MLVRNIRFSLRGYNTRSLHSLNVTNLPFKRQTKYESVISTSYFQNRNTVRNFHATRPQQIWPLVLGVGVGACILAVSAALAETLKNYESVGKEKSGNQLSFPGAFEEIMTRKEAALILDVSETAKKAEILKRYRILMKKNHPDLGGSPFISKKVNEAKETLLSSGDVSL